MGRTSPLSTGPITTLTLVLQAHVGKCSLFSALLPLFSVTQKCTGPDPDQQYLTQSTTVSLSASPSMKKGRDGSYSRWPFNACWTTSLEEGGGKLIWVLDFYLHTNIYRCNRHLRHHRAPGKASPPLPKKLTAIFFKIGCSPASPAVFFFFSLSLGSTA